MNDDSLFLISYVNRAPNRFKILKLFGENDVLTPSEVSRLTGIHINNVSNHLRDLRQNELIYLLNPHFKIGRLYKITDLGADVLKLIASKK